MSARRRRCPATAFAIASSAVLGLSGCPDTCQPYAEPAVLEEPSRAVEDHGLRLTRRLELGGRAAAAVQLDGGVVAVATSTGIDLLDAVGQPPRERLTAAGEPRDLRAVDGDLWVALGTGGITRIRRPEHPAQSKTTSWSAGMDVGMLSRCGARLYGADATGRVVSLPLDAGEETEPSFLEVDGWPRHLACMEGDLLVAAVSGGLFRIAAVKDGTMTAVPPPVDVDYAGAVAADDTRVFVNTFTDLVMAAGGGRRDVSMPGWARDMVVMDRNLAVAARTSGLVTWDGRADAPQMHGLTGTDGISAVTPVALQLLPSGQLLVAGGDSGVHLIEDTGNGWSVAASTPYAGRVRCLERAGTSIAVALGGQHGSSTVVLLATDEHGLLSEAERLVLPWTVRDMAWTGRELLLAGDDLRAVDLDLPADERRPELLGLLDEPVAAVEVLEDDRIALLVRDRGLLWASRDGAGTWSLDAESGVGTVLTPMGLCALGSAVGVTWGNLGRLRMFDDPGASWTADHLLAGQAATNDEGPMRPSGTAADGSRIWVAIPHLGVEGFDPVTGDSVVLRLPPGVHDVSAVGDLLALAMGTAGVSLIDPRRPDDPVVAHLDLPGDTRTVLAHGDLLLAGAGGTLFVLERQDRHPPRP